jgi:hypothetical protein
MRRAFTWLLLVVGAPALVAQTPPVGQTELPPLQCWWRTDRVAVRVGEPLRLTLTCAAAETSAATVVPDWDQLQPDVVDLAPFEVVGGTRSEEVVVPPWRYTQFDYTLRLTGEEFFGVDVPLPPLEISYSIAVGPPGGAVQQGRERIYVLPPLPVKILSLVPKEADDIEEVPAHSFESIERRRGRAHLAFLVGCGLLAAGVLYLLMFVGGAVRALRARRVKPEFRVPEWRIVVGCRAALRKLVVAGGREGWTGSRVGEALTLLRVLGALALDKPPRQQVVARDRPVESGEWVLRRLSLRRPRVAITATTTAAQLRAHPSPRVSGAALDSLAAALSTCSAMRYAPEPDDAGASEAGRAIEDALRASRELLTATLLPVRLKMLAAPATVGGA